ncbi:hypothetical protein BD410DRAFT_785104 [Rickenella mellea]|uniref:DUF6534 domain-containing protein n=1 Tax=Rickenella mellea TaxID=50990 RepID=A0A4Y7QCC2_9AGAM|nr:hypothetical protein BD410DRAFT_785104 [Rickenella mellea]
MGALFLCLLLSTLLFGIICLQAYSYYQKFPEDRVYVKLFVALLLALNLCNVALLSAGMHHYLIENFGNFSALMQPNGLINSSSFLNTFMTSMCQLYFGWRVWRLSNGNYFLTGTIIFLTCTHLAFGTKIVVTAFSAKFNDFQAKQRDSEAFIGTTLGSALACDIMITASLCFFLNRGKTGFRRTDSLVQSLILYSVCTGLITSLFAIVNISVFFSMQTNLVHLGIYFLMGKLYTTSLLATLNSRDIFRSQWNRNDQTVNLSLSSVARPQPSIVASQDRKGRDPIAIYMTHTSDARADDFSLTTTKRDSNTLRPVDDNSTKV